MKQLRNSDLELYGPGKQLEAKMKASKEARLIHQIMKWTNLINDVLNWRISEIIAVDVETHMNGGTPVAVRTHVKIAEKKKASLPMYMHSVRSLIAPVDPDDIEVYDDETVDDDERDGTVKRSGELFVPESEKVKKVYDSMFQMPKKEVNLKTEEERRAEESETRNRREEWRLQTFLNNSLDVSEVENIAEEVWRDPRVDRRLHKTCLALRAACMNHTLFGRKKDQDKFLKQADALRNRGEWTLDKRHTPRRMILTDDLPSWMQSVEAMAAHYRPIWCPEEFNEDGSPNLACHHDRPPGKDSPWTIKRDEATPDATRIGYLFMKLGDAPMIEFIRAVFKECVKSGDVPVTWKTSKTVFLYKKGDSSVPANVVVHGHERDFHPDEDAQAG
jgi:hypothetical protein